MASKRFFVLLALLFSLTYAIHSEMVIDNDYGWSLDLPEGFNVIDQTEDGMSYLFKHDRLPVQLAMRLYNADTYKTSEEALDATLQKLPNSYCEGDNFTYRGRDSALGNFSFALEKNEYSGWALSINLPTNVAHLVLLCYTEKNMLEHCEAFIISSLNSLAIDRGSYYESGIITQFAYPKSESKAIELSIAGKTISTQINKSDLEAAEFLINCEYSVLTLYANNPKWKEAWQRYYRAIYRDSYERLKHVSFDIYNALFFDARAKNKDNPNYELVQTLLSWTQSFTYERTKNVADFTSLLSAIAGEGSDCDTRSLLLCTLLQNMGIKTALFVSKEFSHAIFGAEIDNINEKENARLKAGEVNFLLGETTATVNLGLISKDMSDSSKWIAVELY